MKGKHWNVSWSGKSGGERRFEAVTWGLLLVWVGLMMTVDEPDGLTGVGAGGILLLSALIQRAVGWEAGAVLWVAGFVLVLSGVNELVGEQDVPVLAVLLILFGAAIVGKAVMSGSRARARRDREPGP